VNVSCRETVDDARVFEAALPTRHRHSVLGGAGLSLGNTVTTSPKEAEGKEPAPAGALVTVITEGENPGDAAGDTPDLPGVDVATPP
jgi:hypothetical protein